MTTTPSKPNLEIEPWEFKDEPIAFKTEFPFTLDAPRPFKLIISDVSS